MRCSIVRVTVVFQIECMKGFVLTAFVQPAINGWARVNRSQIVSSLLDGGVRSSGGTVRESVVDMVIRQRLVRCGAVAGHSGRGMGAHWTREVGYMELLWLVLFGRLPGRRWRMTCLAVVLDMAAMMLSCFRAAAIELGSLVVSVSFTV